MGPYIGSHCTLYRAAMLRKNGNAGTWKYVRGTRWPQYALIRAWKGVREAHSGGPVPHSEPLGCSNNMKRSSLWLNAFCGESGEDSEVFTKSKMCCWFFFRIGWAQLRYCHFHLMNSDLTRWWFHRRCPEIDWREGKKTFLHIFLCRLINHVSLRLYLRVEHFRV